MLVAYSISIGPGQPIKIINGFVHAGPDRIQGGLIQFDHISVWASCHIILIHIVQRYHAKLYAVDTPVRQQILAGCDGGKVPYQVTSFAGVFFNKT